MLIDIHMRVEKYRLNQSIFTHFSKMVTKITFDHKRKVITLLFIITIINHVGEANKNKE